jgi:hypothetical protein
MTVDELNALPEIPFFDRDTYPVVNGEARLSDGRVLRGLYGTHVHVPKLRKERVVSFDKDDPICWLDAEGEGWRPVPADDGSWGKTRFRL